MPRTAVLVVIGGLTVPLVILGYVHVVAIEFPVIHAFVMSLLAVLPPLILGLWAVQKECRHGDAREATVRSQMTQTRRDYSRLKETVEESRHKVVQVTSLINSLSSIAKVTMQSLETKKIVAFLMDILSRQIGAKRASLWLVDPDTGKIFFEEGIGWTEEDVLKTEVSLGRGVVGWAIANRVYLDRVIMRQDPTLSGLRNEGGFPSVLCAPLVVNNEAIGAISVEEVERRRQGETRDEGRLVEFVASLAAMAIKNARVFSETRDKANTDGLTKLTTHRFFQETFDAELKRAERYGEFLSLIITDIDHFKKFNDTYGHQVGDLVLRESAAVVKAAVRDMDLVARYGGEEFVCLLPNTNKAGAVKLAERLRTALETREFVTDQGVLRVTMSLGVSTFPVDSKEKIELIRLADAALYEAKDAGRNRVRYANQTVVGASR